MSDPDNRRYDIVLWGATGFAGRLVAEYLAQTTPGNATIDPDDDRRDSPSELRWAIAGRNLVKLEALRADLCDIARGLDELPILVGDSFDAASLDAIAAQTKVVCSTVGPYAKYGSALVASCASHGTDYCDLTGEPHWVRQMLDTHHQQARQNGARLVHCCGFDSIPSDLGTLMVQQAAVDDYGTPCERVQLYVRGASGGLSGGTFASMTNLVDAARRDRDVLKIVADPYALNPAGQRSGPDGPPQKGPHYDKQRGGWTGPFLMASINEKVVRRTNALLECRYGRDFRYDESVYFGPGLKGAVAAGGFSAGLAGFGGLMAAKPTRMLLERFALPSPGQGPSRRDIEEGYFRIELVGRGRRDNGETFEVVGRVGADQDPGYGATAMMLGEAARCLVLDQPAQGLLGGVLTPAAAMGTALLERLRAAGMTFEATTAAI